MEIPQRAGIGGPIQLPAAPASLFPAMYLCSSDATIRDPNVRVYSLEGYEGADPDVEPLCTWDFTGIGTLHAALHVNVLPDGRVLVLGFGPGVSVLIEVPANAPLVDGTPPCRVVWTTASAANSLGLSQFGELLIGIAAVGPNQLHKLAPELVGWHQTVAAGAVIYNDAAIAGEPLGADDLCLDFISGLVWSSRFGAGGSAALWDLTGPPGVVVPSVVLQGSNWDGTVGCAVSSAGELVTANYNDDRINILAGPFASGNPASTRTLKSSANDHGPSAVFFDARTGECVTTYYDTGTVAVFSEAQFFTGGTFAPIRRFNINGNAEGLGFGCLAPSIGVRR